MAHALEGSEPLGSKVCQDNKINLWVDVGAVSLQKHHCPPSQGARASLAPGVALREHFSELGWAGTQIGAQGSPRWE